MESEMKLRILNTIVGNGPKLECDKNTKIKESQCIRKKGHRAALSITGAQRTLLEAKDEFLKNVQKVGHSISSQVQEALEEFKIDWEKSSNDDSIGIEILTTKRLSQLSLDEFMAIKDNIIKAFDFRNERLDSLEGKLTDLERDRSNQLELHLTGFSRQFKKLNYEPPEGIARIAQEECQSANLAIVENRESIHRCIAILRSVNIDVDTRMNKHLKHSSDNWNQARIKSIVENDQRDRIYANVLRVVEDMERQGRNQLSESRNYHFKVSKGTIKMTCIQMANIEFVAETKPYCKTAEINAGKRLGTSLSSQASRNRDVMNKVAEFIVCLLSLKAETADRIIKAEFDTVTKVHEMSIKLTAEQNVYETNLRKELQTMRIETHESSIVKRLVKCKRASQLYQRMIGNEDYAHWKISINEAVSQRITSKIEKLASVRHLQIIEYEKRLHYMIDVAQGRIDSLKHLRTTHENEACLILNRVKKVQARYASEIDQLINSSHEFSAKVISPLTSRLNKASSQSAVSRIQYEVQDAIKQHTTTLKQCLFTAISDFDDSKAVLIKSQLVGHHSAAWQIMGEACLIDSESFAHEMDRWRDTFDARIEDVQAKQKIMCTGRT
ncbi:hypothetical protein BSLG_005097 [Batrachochytrium salamandrivorans]|nr:hypothetical protein BSLG_005097 [Batrachochytrium salamandrivorans]